jgi:AcrR family transcriptional regulator
MSSTKPELNINQPWIDAGYAMFSKNGPGGMKVDLLAKAVGKSRSSFYHHFADVEIFMEEVLKQHMLRAVIVAEKTKRCKGMDPDFLLLIIEEKDYILFNRQLRMNRHVAEYKTAFESSMALVFKHSMVLWCSMMGIENNADVARNSYGITADVLFHRLTEESFNLSWLKAFMEEIKAVFKKMNTIQL